MVPGCMINFGSKLLASCNWNNIVERELIDLMEKKQDCELLQNGESQLNLHGEIKVNISLSFFFFLATATSHQK